MAIAQGIVAFRSAKGRPFAERKATDGAKGDRRGHLSAGLSCEAMLRDIHLKLYGQLGRHHDHVQARPADAIHRDASAEFTGPERLERLIRNLIRALKDEPILLVLDNFETNLKPIADCRLSLRESRVVRGALSRSERRHNAKTRRETGASR